MFPALAIGLRSGNPDVLGLGIGLEIGRRRLRRLVLGGILLASAR
jgi:hypothetical protein